MEPEVYALQRDGDVVCLRAAILAHGLIAAPLSGRSSRPTSALPALSRLRTQYCHVRVGEGAIRAGVPAAPRRHRDRIDDRQSYRPYWHRAALARTTDVLERSASPARGIMVASGAVTASSSSP